MSAIDELRAAAFTTIEGEDVVHLDRAERIITAQEQRLSELEAEVARLSHLHQLDHSLADQWQAKSSKLEVENRAKDERIEQQEQRIGELEAQLAATGETSDGYHTFNELYEHRHALFAVLCAVFGGWKSKLHADATMFDGWFIAGLMTPAGQVTYHLPISWWDRYKCEELPVAPQWDGHTAQDVQQRVQTLAAALENSKPAANHREENCPSSECPIHGTEMPSKMSRN